MVYDRPDFSEKKLTMRKSVRAFCIDCMGGKSRGYESPRYCVDVGCPLWPWREPTGQDRSYKIQHPPDDYYQAGRTESIV